MLNKSFLVGPRLTFEIMVAEPVDQNFSLIEPRGMGGGVTRTPPVVGIVGQVLLWCIGSVTGIAVLNEKHTVQGVMTLAKPA